MSYQASNGASTSGVGGIGGAPTCPWVSLTLKEQLQNIRRTLREHYKHRTAKFDDAYFEKAARIVKKLRHNLWADLGSLPVVGDGSFRGDLFLGATALHWAVLMNDRKMVRYILISGKVDINAAAGAYKVTALNYATRSVGNSLIVEDLLEHNAHVSICHNFQTSALRYMVVRKGSMFGILKRMIAKNVNMCDQRKYTALHYAIQEGAQDIVTYLLDNNADVNFLNIYGQSPLHHAVLKGDVGTVKCLLEHSTLRVNTLDVYGQSPLQYATELGSLAIVRCLLEHKANVNALNKDGENPLHYATRKEAMDIVVYLLQNNAKVNTLNKSGYSPLHYAVQNAVQKGSLFIVECLLLYDAHVDTVNSIEHDSPLHYAAHEGCLDIVVCLLKQVGVVNTLNAEKQTPLHYAARRGAMDVVRCLLQHCADINALDTFGRSPLIYATKAGSLDIVTYLVEHNAHVNTLDKDGKNALTYAVEVGSFDIVTYLLEHHVDINTLDEDGQSVLLLSIKGRKIDISEKLIASGADVHSKGKDGNNGLHLAIQAYGMEEKMVNIVKLLRLQNVDINAKNLKGYSPFFAAVEKGHTDVVKELLKSKEKIRLMEECNGQTVIQIAYDNGHEHIKRALLECDDVSRYVEILYRDRQVYVDAANAILIGAALIAGVTFNSWLQPPLGYTTSYFFDSYSNSNLAPSSSNLNYVDLQDNVPLRVFWVFNSLSFYFSIGTVVFGARSVLPRRQLFIKDIVKKLHKNLLVTSLLLACSAFFVIIAFGIAGCIVLTPMLKFQWYMIGPTIFGGLVCLISLGFLFKSILEDNLARKKKEIYVF